MKNIQAISFAYMAEELAVDRKKQRWRIAIFFFFSGILTATWASRIPDIQQKLALNNAALGTVLFSIPVGLVTGLSFASWAIVSFGAKRMMLASTLLTALAVVLAGLASTTFLLMLTLWIFGIGRTVLNISANTGALEIQRLYDRPIIASFHGLWSLACFVAAGIGTVMIIWEVKPVWHFFVMASLVGLLVVPQLQKGKQSAPATERRPFFVKPDKYLFLLGLTALSAMLCEGAMFDWSVNYFEKVVQTEKHLVTTGYIAFIVAMTFGRLVGDRIVHWLGHFRVLAFCGVLIAVGFFTAAIFPSLFPAACGFLVIGLGDSVLVPVVYMLASKSQKMPVSYALSSVTMVGYSGFLIGPLLIGNVSQHWSMTAAFYLLSVIGLVIVLLSFQVKRQAALLIAKM